MADLRQAIPVQVSVDLMHERLNVRGVLLQAALHVIHSCSKILLTCDIQRTLICIVFPAYLLFGACHRTLVNHAFTCECL